MHTAHSAVVHDTRCRDVSGKMRKVGDLIRLDCQTKTDEPMVRPFFWKIFFRRCGSPESQWRIYFSWYPLLPVWRPTTAIRRRHSELCHDVNDSVFLFLILHLSDCFHHLLHVRRCHRIGEDLAIADDAVPVDDKQGGKGVMATFEDVVAAHHRAQVVG